MCNETIPRIQACFDSNCDLPLSMLAPKTSNKKSLSRLNPNSVDEALFLRFYYNINRAKDKTSKPIRLKRGTCFAKKEKS